MTNPRRKFSAEEKVNILRLHLLEKQPVSDVCDKFGLNPNVFYRWQKQFFENGASAFNHADNGHKDSHTKRLEEKVSRLQAKLERYHKTIKGTCIRVKTPLSLAAAREARKAKRKPS